MGECFKRSTSFANDRRTPSQTGYWSTTTVMMNFAMLEAVKNGRVLGPTKPVTTSNGPLQKVLSTKQVSE
jgi:hypothetical protein